MLVLPRWGFQVEEHIDMEMERLGRKSSDEGDESKPIFPGLVPQDPYDQMIKSPSGSQQHDNKVPWTHWTALTFFNLCADLYCSLT